MDAKQDDDENGYRRHEMLRLLRTLTPGLLAACHLGVAQAATHAIPPGANAIQENKAAHSSEEEHAVPSFSPVDKVMQRLTSNGYERWNTIEWPTLSRDGQWIAYTLQSSAGDGELIIRSTRTSTEWRVSRGALLALPEALKPSQFTADSTFLIFGIASLDTKVVGGVGSNHSSPNLGIVRLSDGRLTKIAAVSSVVIPKRTSGKYIAYLGTVSPTVAPDSVLRVESLRSDGAELPAGQQTLVLYDLSGDRRQSIADVDAFLFNESGSYLAYTRPAQLGPRSGVYVVCVRDGRIIPVLTGFGHYRSLVFDEPGKSIAFLSDKHAGDRSDGPYYVYYAKAPFSTVTPLVSSEVLSGKHRISSHAGLHFKGDALLFGISRVEKESAPQSSGKSRANFDLWHWRDPETQPRKKFGNLGKFFVGIYHLRERQWAQLGHQQLATVLVTEDARHAIGLDYRSYMVPRTWGDFAADLYRVDVMTGEARLLRREMRSGEWLEPAPDRADAIRLSPQGNYALYFENRRWFSYDFRQDKLIDLTGALLPNAQFDLEQSYVTPGPSVPVGIAGWLVNDERVLIYDQYDIWEIDPSGEVPPKNLTEGVGHSKRIIFRVWPDDWKSSIRRAANTDLITFTLNQSLLLTAFNQETMASGIWRDKIGGRELPQPLVMKDKKLNLISRITMPQQFLLTQEAFSEFPDLWTGQQLDKLKRVSDANAHQTEYRWGSVESVEWTSKFGVPLKGLLYTPEYFSPRRKYPMIVHIYGQFTPDMHRYERPAPNSSAGITSPAKYLSDNYIVFRPDVISATPYPGESALASVTAGVQSIIDRGYVDPSRIGLVGHSWGGTQAAYLITRTALFRCAVIGASISNTISDYGSIQAGGLVRSYKYEERGGQHGSSVWENPLVYLVNSPIMFADRVRTPVLLLHNYNDNAVPFSQGLEFYIALRRNAKEAYLLSYAEEQHGLSSRTNQLDWDLRMQQFLDYFLKDGPEPDWMAPRE